MKNKIINFIISVLPKRKKRMTIKHFETLIEFPTILNIANIKEKESRFKAQQLRTGARILGK